MGLLPYHLTDEQVQEHGANGAAHLATAGQRQPVSQADSMALAGLAARGVGENEERRSPAVGHELLEPFNDFMAKPAPDNLIWGVVRFVRFVICKALTTF